MPRKVKLSTHGWTEEQLRCPHETVRFEMDNSSGGWFEICKVCEAYTDGGMIGHN